MKTNKLYRRRTKSIVRGVDMVLCPNQLSKKANLPFFPNDSPQPEAYVFGA